MEVRLLVAYALMAAIGLVGLVAMIVIGRRRAARRRRLRGIKVDQLPRSQRP